MYGHGGPNQPTQARNWQKHIHGELALVTSQLPEAYILDYPHQFFVDGRFHLVSPQTLFVPLTRQPSLLTPSEPTRKDGRRYYHTEKNRLK